MGKPPTRPLQGEMVKRPPPNDDSTEGVEGLKGATGFIDGVLSVFEGIGREQARFSFVHTANAMPCNFCTESTNHRLIVVRRGEESKICMCDVCKDAIGQA